MSFEIAAKVWDYQGQDLNGVQKAILVRMAWYAGMGGENPYPSINALAQQTGFNKQAVTEAIQHFVDHQFLITNDQTENPIKHKINSIKLDI